MLVLPFAPTPAPVPPPPPDGCGVRRVVLASAAVVAASTLLPWIALRMAQLWSSAPGSGPPGWRTSAGFTCLCTSLLIALLTLAETRTPTTAQATRPGSLVLAAAALLTLGAEWLAGPGLLHGVSAEWTLGFHAAIAGVALLSAAAAVRAARGDPGAAAR